MGKGEARPPGVVASRLLAGLLLLLLLLLLSLALGLWLVVCFECEGEEEGDREEDFFNKDAIAVSVRCKRLKAVCFGFSGSNDLDL